MPGRHLAKRPTAAAGVGAAAAPRRRHRQASTHLLKTAACRQGLVPAVRQPPRRRQLEPAPRARQGTLLRRPGSGGAPPQAQGMRLRTVAKADKYSSLRDKAGYKRKH